MTANRMRSMQGLGLGMLVALGLIGVRALAQEPPPAAAAHAVQKCRLFTLADLEKDRDLNTEDRSTEIGQWVTAREAEGWRLVGIDFEIGQKSTGYPQAWQQVCLEKGSS